MTTYTWPDPTVVREMLPKSLEVRQISLTQASSSPMNGAVHTYGMPGGRWGFSVTFQKQSYAQRAVVEAWMMKLSGMEHRIRMWDMARPLPLGTINQTGVTVSVLASQFAETIVLANCGATRTLLAGDWFEVTTSTGQQLLMCTETSTSSAGGVMTVPFRHRLRGSVAAASAVVLQQPKALFIMETNDVTSPRDPQNTAPEFGVNFIETFA